MTRQQEIERLKDEQEKELWEDTSRGREPFGDSLLKLTSDRRWNGQPMYKDQRRFF